MSLITKNKCNQIPYSVHYKIIKYSKSGFPQKFNRALFSFPVAHIILRDDPVGHKIYVLCVFGNDPMFSTQTMSYPTYIGCWNFLQSSILELHTYGTVTASRPGAGNFPGIFWKTVLIMVITVPATELSTYS